MTDTVSEQAFKAMTDANDTLYRSVEQKDQVLASLARANETLSKELHEQRTTLWQIGFGVIGVNVSLFLALAAILVALQLGWLQ